MARAGTPQRFVLYQALAEHFPEVALDMVGDNFQVLKAGVSLYLACGKVNHGVHSLNALASTSFWAFLSRRINWSVDWPEAPARLPD